MENGKDKIAILQDHIRDLEQEIIDTKKMINRFSIRQGNGTVYADADLSGSVGNINAIRTDQFYGQSFAGAIRDYLDMRRAANIGPATVNEIYAALISGGYQFEGTTDEENRKRNLRISLTKSSATFHKLPDGSHYGLVTWYPNAKTADDEDASPKKSNKGKSKRKKSKASKPDKADADEATSAKTKTAKPIDKASATPTTLLGAIEMALNAMTDEFTKQDVADWIEKRYPALKAEEKKKSVFTMINRFKKTLNLVTAQAGKGSEPHRFKREKAATNGHDD